MSLLDAIAGEIRRGEIGPVVCVRGLLELSADHGRQLAGLAVVLESSSLWMGQPWDHVFATSDASRDHVSVLGVAERGGTAVLSSTVLREGAPRLDLLVLASRGSVRHEGRPNAGHYRDSEDLLPGAAPLSPAGKAIHEALERSLSSGKPARIREAGR